ncbi:hypothetical protein ABEY50_13435 [Priestia megaterium]
MKIIELAEFIKTSKKTTKLALSSSTVQYTLETDDLKIELKTGGTNKRIVFFRIFLKGTYKDWICYHRNEHHIYELYQNISLSPQLQKQLLYAIAP